MRSSWGDRLALALVVVLPAVVLFVLGKALLGVIGRLVLALSGVGP